MDYDISYSLTFGMLFGCLGRPGILETLAEGDQEAPGAVCAAKASHPLGQLHPLT